MSPSLKRFEKRLKRAINLLFSQLNIDKEVSAIHLAHYLVYHTIFIVYFDAMWHVCARSRGGVRACHDHNGVENMISIKTEEIQYMLQKACCLLKEMEC